MAHKKWRLKKRETDATLFASREAPLLAYPFLHRERLDKKDDDDDGRRRRRRKDTAEYCVVKALSRDESLTFD